MALEPANRLFQQQDPASHSPPCIGDRQVDHEQVARTDCARQAPLHDQAAEREHGQVAAQQQRAGEHAAEDQEQVDVVGQGPAEDQGKDQQVLPAFSRDRGPTTSVHVSLPCTHHAPP